MRGRWKRRTALFVMVMLSVSAACGCGDAARSNAPAGGEGEGKESVSPYPASLSGTSSPSDVTAVLIEALDGGDGDTLQGLVAVKAEAAMIEAIFRKHGRKHNARPEEAARLAAAGWGASYAFFKKGATAVIGEQVNGEQALVRAKGQLGANGQPRGLEIRLIREDGVWKVRAGLKSVRP